MKKFKIPRNSIIVTWIISYLMVLVMPIVASSFLYVKIYDFLQNAVIKDCVSKNIALQYRTDELIRIQQKISKEVAYHDLTKKILYMTETERKNYVHGYDYTQYLWDIKKTEPSIEDIYVYFSKEDIIYSNTGSASSRSFYNAQFKRSSEEVTYESWLEQLGLQETKLVNFPGSGIRKNANSLALVRSIYTDNENNFATVVVTIDEKNILNNADLNAENQENAIAILDDEGHVLTTSDPALTAGLGQDSPLEVLPEINKIRHGAMSGVVLVSESTETNLKYLYFVPDSIIKNDIKNYSILMLLSAIGAIVLGAGTIRYWVKRNYKPINELVSIARENSADDLKTEGVSEFNLIRTSFHRLEQKYRSNEEKQRALLERNFLSNLLTGNRIRHNQAYDEFKDQYENNSFGVVVFYPVDVSALFGEENVDEDKEYLAHYILENICSELLPGEYRAKFLQYNETTVCILNVHPGLETVGEDVYDKLEECQEFIYEKFNVKYQVSVSNIHPTMYGISEAYDEAIQAMEYILIENSTEDLISYRDVAQSKKAYRYPNECEQQLILFITSGDYKSAKAVVEQIEADNFSDDKINIILLKLLILDIVATIVKTLDHIDGKEQAVFNQDVYRNLSTIVESKNMQDMRNGMYHMLSKFCDFFESNRQHRSKEFPSAEIKRYIETNFSDLSLNVSAVAEAFELNVSYLSRMYKESEGVGLLEFINGYRVEQSLNFLCCGDNLEQVARKSGFSNAKTYTRVFKKRYGITPGKYKEDHS